MSRFGVSGGGGRGPLDDLIEPDAPKAGVFFNGTLDLSKPIYGRFYKDGGEDLTINGTLVHSYSGGILSDKIIFDAGTTIEANSACYLCGIELSDIDIDGTIKSVSKTVPFSVPSDETWIGGLIVNSVSIDGNFAGTDNYPTVVLPGGTTIESNDFYFGGVAL
jgi:hypothetical protein